MINGLKINYPIIKPKNRIKTASLIEAFFMKALIKESVTFKTREKPQTQLKLYIDRLVL